MLQFTESEVEEFLRISMIYKERFSDVKRLGEDIKLAEHIVKTLISEIEQAKNEEELLYRSLSEKYNTDETEIKNQVAQTVLKYL